MKIVKFFPRFSQKLNFKQKITKLPTLRNRFLRYKIICTLIKECHCGCYKNWKMLHNCRKPGDLIIPPVTKYNYKCNYNMQI